jgi:hypothetical protein
MRTTLDLDDRVLAAARALAHSRRISMGRAVSELALRGLDQADSAATDSGFPVLARVTGHVITDDMVEAGRDDI